MSLRATLRNLWESILPRSRNDVEEEFRSTLEAYRDDLIHQGLSSEEATRKARIDLGQPATQNETYRNAIGLRIFDELGGDIRYGLRGLRRNPGFAAVAILSLAIGIGATTAMFSLIYAVLLHPFPYAGADRIMNPVIVNEQSPDQPQWFPLTKPQFEALRQAAPVENLLGFNNWKTEITGGDLPEDLHVTYLTENADSFFGVRALLGRGIQPSDAQHGGQHVAVLNYRFWQRHYNGDPHVIGRTLEIDHALYSIVGVMPDSFAFNDTNGVADVYLPISLMRSPLNLPWMCIPWIKLKPHTTPAAADAALEPLVRQFAKDNNSKRYFPDRWKLALQPIIVPYQQSTGRTLTLLLCGVVLLLIIGCVNCSILLLARGRARRHELAIRSAVGASRWRIVRQLLVEAVVISFTGAILGVAASYWLARLPLLLSADSFPQESILRINLPVLAFSVALALLSGMIFGLVPALRLSRPDVSYVLPSRMHGLSAVPTRHRWSALIAAQITLTLLLMATAGTAIRSFLELTQLPLGYDPDHAMQLGIMMHTVDARQWSTIQSREARAAFLEQVRQKIAAVPGITVAAVGTDATPPYSGQQWPVEIVGHLHAEQPQAITQTVGPAYFAALRIPLLHGRIWDAAENANGDFIAVVNQAFVNRYLTKSDPLGRQIRIPGFTPQNRFDVASSHSADWRQIVGVVGDVRNQGVDQPVAPAIYVPYTSVMLPYAQYMVRTQGDPLAYLHAIRAAVATVGMDQQISNGAYTLNEAIQRDSQYTRQRLFSILFGVFSAMALALALVGIFSVVAYSVAQRTTEFGVRLALGASRSHILWVAGRIALTSTAIGLAIGLICDAFLGKLLSAWMHNAFAATGLITAAVLLILSAIAACLLPATRATNVPPAEALRYE